MAGEKKQRVCPSCGTKMLGGKYCPECRAELVDEDTVGPSEKWMSEMVERTAKRTAEILKQEMEETPNAERDLPEKEKKTSFFRK